jgi:hypothetical protein
MTEQSPEQPVLSQAFGLAHGFDIFGRLGTSGLLRPLIDYSDAPMQRFTLMGADYLIPAFVNAVQNPTSTSRSEAFDTREGFQGDVAAHAGVTAQSGAFSGEMEAAFSAEYRNSTSFSYAYQQFYSQLASLELTGGAEYLVPGFRGDIDALPASFQPTDEAEFIRFFNTWGIYYTQRVILGGSLKLYTSVAESSGLTRMEISALVKAQYTSLFETGVVSADAQAKGKWTRYAEHSRSMIQVEGGDPAKAAALRDTDATQPSKATASRLNPWIETVARSPAIVDFRLAGIWELCGQKREAVNAAWEFLRPRIRPRLSVRTSSVEMSGGGMTPEPPVVILGDDLAPQAPPATATGFQVLILGASGRLGSDSVLFNRYFTVPAAPDWTETYGRMYDEMAAAVVESGVFTGGNVLVAVSFGLDRFMPPSPAFNALLLRAGAGDELDRWQQGAFSPGSMAGGGWISYPANYVLVGIIGDGPRTGTEAPWQATTGARANARLDVYFYPQSFAGKYTLGPAPRD